MSSAVAETKSWSTTLDAEEKETIAAVVDFPKTTALSGQSEVGPGDMALKNKVGPNPIIIYTLQC